jgi:hypothetical protein
LEAVFLVNMSTPTLHLMSLGLVLAAGCESPRKASPAAESTAPITATASSAAEKTPMEYKTVEFVETSDNDIRAHMAQWAKEGWNVLSISPRLTQADGTVVRKVELSRARQ